MLLHQLGDDLVLLDELGLEPLNKLCLKSLHPGWSSRRPLPSALSLVEHLFNPRVDLAGLKAELVGQFGNRLFAADVTTHNLTLLRNGEMSA
jgi:hypothetical protein